MTCSTGAAAGVLDLLREGDPARGVDINDEMAAAADRVGSTRVRRRTRPFLAQPDGSLGGLFAAQVVEHLEPDISAAARTAYLKLRPGSRSSWKP